MVVLKKIKASTLMETLVASVLIIVVFMVSSLILNNVFANTINNNTQSISSHLNELEYRYRAGVLSIPYKDDCEGWDIYVDKNNDFVTKTVLFRAENISNKKTIEKEVHAD